MVAKRKDDLEEHSQPQSSSSLGTASALAGAGREAFPFPPAPLLQGGPHLLQVPVSAGGARDPMVAKSKDDLEQHSQSHSPSSLGTASAMAVAREQELRAGHFPSAGLRGRAGRGGAGREAFPFPFPPAPVVQGGGPHLLQRPQGAPLLQSHGHGKRAPLLRVPLGGACGAE